VRRVHRDGLVDKDTMGAFERRKKKREIPRREGISRETSKKILAHPDPPEHCLKEPRPKPKIGPYLERIAQIIEEDLNDAKKVLMSNSLGGLLKGL
jgi:hypothetical protein